MKMSQNIMTMNVGNGPEMTFVAGATKINPKNLKTKLWLHDLMQTAI